MYVPYALRSAFDAVQQGAYTLRWIIIGISCTWSCIAFHIQYAYRKMGLICGARKTLANRIPNILPQNYENCLFPWTFNVVPVNVIYFEVDDGESWIFASRVTRSVCFEFEFGPIFTYATNATISMIRIWHHKQFNCCVPTVLVAFAIEFAEFSVFICCWIVISIHRKLWYERTDEHGDDAGE